MKKNVMMRVASALLVAVLLTTCSISGTFAKYVTEDAGADQARVAKWGVELQVVGNLFGDTYVNDIVEKTALNFSVQSLNKTDDLVAPGTKNDQGFTFSLKGQPEVDGLITTTMTIQNVFLAANTYGVMIPLDAALVNEGNFAEFTGLYYKDSDNYKKATAYSGGVEYYTLEDEVTTTDYYPVVYKLAGNTSNTGDNTADSLKAAADKIATQLGLVGAAPAADTSISYTGTKAFEANYDLAGLAVDGLTLTWAWAIGDNLDANADTILGMLEQTTEGAVVKLSNPADPDSDYVPVVEYTDYCLDTKFDLKINVAQVD